MLLPVVLFGALMADLGRPLSEDEWDHPLGGARGVVETEWPANKARCWLRGCVLAAVIKPGMTQDDVRRVAGAVPRLTPGPEGTRHGVQSLALGISLWYRSGAARINGQRRMALVVDQVRATELHELIALFLPARCGSGDE
jgi:hypothetical protein